MSAPTVSRMITAPSASEMPWTMPFSIDAHVWPWPMPIRMATPAASMRAIWLAPPDDPSPKSATDDASSATSTATGIRDIRSVGVRAGRWVMLGRMIPRGLQKRGLSPFSSQAF